MSSIAALTALPYELQACICENLTIMDLHCFGKVSKIYQRNMEKYVNQWLDKFILNASNPYVCTKKTCGGLYVGTVSQYLKVVPMILIPSREKLIPIAMHFIDPPSCDMEVTIDRGLARQLLIEKGTVDICDLVKLEDYVNCSSSDSSYDEYGSNDDDNDTASAASSDCSGYVRYQQALGDCEYKGWTVSLDFLTVPAHSAIAECRNILATASRHFLADKGPSHLPSHVTGDREDFETVAEVIMAIIMAVSQATVHQRVVDCTSAMYQYDYRGDTSCSDMKTQVIQYSFGQGCGLGVSVCFRNINEL